MPRVPCGFGKVRFVSQRARAVPWWVALAAVAAFVVLPGPARSLFSGAPLSAPALVLFVALLILGVFTALYPPDAVVRTPWLVVLLLLVAAKVILAGMLVDTGWRGEYWTSADWTRDGTRLRPADFVTHGRIRPWRTDPRIDFDPGSFELDFLNDPAPRTAEATPEGRDVQFPLRVRWHGWVVDPKPLDLTVTAAGRLQLVADGRLLLSASDPGRQKVQVDGVRGGTPAAHELTIDYLKPNGVTAGVSVAGIDGVIVADRVDIPRLRGSPRAALLVAILGIVALAVLLAAFRDAYPSLRALVRERVATTPTKLVSLLFFALFMTWGVRQTMPLRHVTLLEGLGDDPLAYESQARQIIRTGWLMAEPGTPGQPYYFYPLYPYVLAGAHLLLGEDHGAVVLFQYVCLGAVGILAGLFLGKRIGGRAGVIALAALALFVWRFAVPYTANAFTDNLYLPLVLAVVAAAVAALERRSLPLLLLTGVATALGAATRPSFLLFVPCFGLWLLLDGEAGASLRERIRAAGAFAGGFLAGVAPFTLRNWIVSKRFVLLVASYAMIPYFLYPPEGTTPPLLIPTADGYGRPPNLVESLQQILAVWRASPQQTAWTEVRKVLFTFGLTRFGPPAAYVPFGLLLCPLLFAAALWSGRMPRHVRNVVLVFGVSHLAALVIAAPWTYGYKTILPLHMLFLLSAAFLIPNTSAPKKRAPAAERAEGPSRRRRRSHA